MCLGKLFCISENPDGKRKVEKKKKRRNIPLLAAETCEDSPRLEFLSTVGSQSACVFPGLLGVKNLLMFFRPIQPQQDSRRYK